MKDNCDPDIPNLVVSTNYISTSFLDTKNHKKVTNLWCGGGIQSIHEIVTHIPISKTNVNLFNIVLLRYDIIY